MNAASGGERNMNSASVEKRNMNTASGGKKTRIPPQEEKKHEYFLRSGRNMNTTS